MMSDCRTRGLAEHGWKDPLDDTWSRVRERNAQTQPPQAALISNSNRVSTQPQPHLSPLAPDPDPLLDFFASKDVDPILFPPPQQEVALTEEQQLDETFKQYQLDQNNRPDNFGFSSYLSPALAGFNHIHINTNNNVNNSPASNYMTKSISQASNITSSFFPIPLPSGFTGSSYENIPLHNRSYSNNSQRTGISAVSESSNANVEGWCELSTPELDCAVFNDMDLDMMDGDMMDGIGDLLPIDQAMVLGGMYTATPQPVPNPYAATTLAENPNQTQTQTQTQNQMGEFMYQDMNNFTFVNQNMDTDLNTNLSPQPEKLRSAGPWNSIDHQVPRFGAGYPVFMPSPGPAVPIPMEEDMMDEGMATTFTDMTKPKKVVAYRSRVLERKEKASPRPRSSTVNTKGRDKRKGKQTTIVAWENIVVAENGGQQVLTNAGEPSRRPGVRSGKLDPEAAQKALAIRRLKACWPCWVQKVPCSTGEVCQRCRKHFSPTEGQVCSRSGFRDCESAFFPGYLHEHLNKRRIEELVSEHASGWLDLSIKVDISTGQIFQPMRLDTTVFTPKTVELMSQTRLTTVEEGQESQIVMQYSAPIGMMGLFLPQLKLKCEDHVEKMVRNPEYSGQCTAGDKTQLPRELLEVVGKYCEKKDAKLLRNVMKLHAFHYFMGALPTFTQESAMKIQQKLNLQASQPPSVYFSSRLLNRQVKFAMHKLHREIMLEVLEGLEKMIRARTKDYWGTSFCAILMIGLCIENLQTAADMFVLTDMVKEGDKCQFTRDQSTAACLSIENPFHMFKRLFHEVYKTHKEVGGKDSSWNPLHLVDTGNDIGSGDPLTDAMVRSIYDLVCKNWLEINKLADNPMMANLKGVASDMMPSVAKANNTGRLAASFLKSFFL